MLHKFLKKIELLAVEFSGGIPRNNIGNITGKLKLYGEEGFSGAFLGEIYGRFLDEF